MLSLIVPYRHSTKMAERFKYFLKSVDAQKIDDIEIILAEYLDKYDGSLPSFVKRVEVEPIKFHNGIPVFFHQSYINNIGALNSSGDILLFSNADIIFSTGVFQHALDVLREREVFMSVFVWYAPEFIWKKIKNGELKVDIDFDIILQNSFINKSQAPRAAFQAIRKDSFLKLGGYDVDMWGWGAEEYEFYLRAKQIMPIYHTDKYQCVHLWHEPNWGPHHPRRGGIKGANMQLVAHKKGIWRDPLTGSYNE